MAYRIRRGLGRTMAEDATCKASLFGGFFSPTCWTSLEPNPLAPPPAPTGAALTTPPASGADAQATVDALLNEQMRAQQALAAQQVQSSAADQAASAVVDTAGAVSDAAESAANALAAPFGVPWWAWLAGGVGIFAFAALGSGSPRRYGR